MALKSAVMENASFAATENGRPWTKPVPGNRNQALLIFTTDRIDPIVLGIGSSSRISEALVPYEREVKWKNRSAAMKVENIQMGLSCAIH
ncbi:hypothetical protein [Desulforhabdus sp. TSK]|uniref:hypothetical protein n=1 Tax=Desulforhabdus sp. TSK TaxID=2925014 RepID=UPI001FC88F41|nr:hypothetical protein [Desulforhabdus sp. TSK]GKT06948.1 hypothetical protein DSTSK_02530 [Desulforhabdus sp. TSK]